MISKEENEENKHHIDNNSSYSKNDLNVGKMSKFIFTDNVDNPKNVKSLVIKDNKELIIEGDDTKIKKNVLQLNNPSDYQSISKKVNSFYFSHLIINPNINDRRSIKEDKDFFQSSQKNSFRKFKAFNIFTNKSKTSKNKLPFKKSFISFLFIIIIIVIKYKHNKNFNICVCTIAKGENRYIREYVEYYKNYGIDKIFIYDNNERNGEKFDDILSDYIKNNFVRVINIRGKKRVQIDSFNHCNRLNYQKYNWMIFFDIDEFLFLKNYTNAKDYLKGKRFEKCKAIFLNELVHTDNDQIYYLNKSVLERFPEIKYNKTDIMIKTILRGRIPHISIYNNHVMRLNWEGCDGRGNKIKYDGVHTQNPDLINYYFHHYFTKSAEEYLIKISKGSVFWGDERKIDLDRLKYYFAINKITEPKINFFENRTRIDLTSIREKLKK